MNARIGFSIKQDTHVQDNFVQDSFVQDRFAQDSFAMSATIEGTWSSL